jgi:hypothetical protein
LIESLSNGGRLFYFGWNKPGLENLTLVPLTSVTVRDQSIDSDRSLSSNKCQIRVVSDVGQLLAQIWQGSKLMPPAKEVIGWRGQ